MRHRCLIFAVMVGGIAAVGVGGQILAALDPPRLNADPVLTRDPSRLRRRR